MRTTPIISRLSMPAKQPAQRCLSSALRSCLPSLLACALWGFSGLVAAGSFQLAVPSHAKGNAIEQSLCVLRLKSALASLGYELQLRYAPGRRALLLASTGQVDGDLARSNQVEGNYTNLRRVSMPCTTIQPALYGVVQETMTWPQRRLRKIAYFRGSTRLLSSLADSLNDYELVYTSSSEQSFKLLRANRVDAVFISKSLFRQLGQVQPDLVSVVAQLTPELDQINLYTYLHKRHEGLIVKLDQLMAAEFSGLPAEP